MGDGGLSIAMLRFAREYHSYRDRLPSIPYAYSRTRLAITPEYEIVAMNWAPLSVSPIHDHGTSRCWVLMLEGALDVANFACDPADVTSDSVVVVETGHFALGPGDVDHRLGPTELHRVRNPSATQNAFSLQLYAAPLATYSIVDARSQRRRVAGAICELDLTLETAKNAPPP
ncbi:MAG: cysteine dioxygenase family protein [Candidatus Tumulicola sp.]